MAKRTIASSWAKAFHRTANTLTRSAIQAQTRYAERALHVVADQRKPPEKEGDWLAGVAMGLHGMRRFRLYRPPDVASHERLPLMVMLHGCGQDAKSFALSTRMNRVAARERFLVLYPEQDRMANTQGCWNWFDTSGGRAHAEAALILKAIDQVSMLYQVDPRRIAVAGLSAGASMAALLATRHPEHFKAVIMHSGVPPGAAHSSMSAIGAMYGARRVRPLPTTTPAYHGPDRPPLLVIHGRMDHVVAASNGQAAVEAWAQAVGARASQKRRVQRGERYPVSILDFKNKGDVIASLVEVEQLGHAWSGGADQKAFSDARGPDASRMAWAFAAKQFKRVSDTGSEAGQ